MILLVVFPFAFLLLPGGHEWNLPGQEALAHCCAAHCPLAPSSWQPLCAARKMVFLCCVHMKFGACVVALCAEPGVLPQPGPAPSALGAPQLWDMGLHLQHVQALKQRRAFSVSNKTQIADGGLHQLEMKPISLQAGAVTLSKVMEAGAASLGWELCPPCIPGYL